MHLMKQKSIMQINTIINALLKEKKKNLLESATWKKQPHKLPYKILLMLKTI